MIEEEYLNQIRSSFEKIHFMIDDDQAEKLYHYYKLLIETNKVMNLTAITDFSDVLTRHFLDSAALTEFLNFNQYNKVLDVGTGAGFPGIPLKIMFPHLKLTLLDSLNKRISFLQTACAELELEDVEFIHGRAEDYARKPEYREKYDLCLSRAVANLSTLSEYCIPYVRKGGLFVSYKSGKIEDELKQAEFAINELGGVPERINKFCLPDTDIERTFVFVQKVKTTSTKYPRKAGIPGKEPLASV